MTERLTVTLLSSVHSFPVTLVIHLSNKGIPESGISSGVYKWQLAFVSVLLANLAVMKYMPHGPGLE